MRKIDNFIGGASIPPALGEYLANEDPAQGVVYSEVADSSEEDLERAVGAAKKAQPAWGRMSVMERCAILTKMADLIAEAAPELARAESIDCGKPLSLAQGLDIPRAVSNLRFFAAAAPQLAMECHPVGDGILNYTRRDPLGVVTCIAPWNLPLYLLTWKIAPALAMGNCVLAKPTEVCPMTASMLGAIANKAGLPAGVLNILNGRGARIGQAICEHPEVKAVSFTGGTISGRQIAKTVAGSFKKISLELGGKNPMLIFADANFDKAVSETVRAAFSNQGQICLCTSRILVEASIYDRFVAAVVEKTRALKVKDPLEEDCDQGAMVSKAHFNKVMSYIELAKKEGAEFLTGGRAKELSGRCAKGYFIEPTLIQGLGPKNRLNQEEVFGPLAALIPFHTEDEAIEIANGTDYGLCASVFSQDINRCHRLARSLEAGVVWINSWMLRDLRIPFGGFKQSGFGREGGFDSLRFFTETKNVCIDAR